MFACNESLEDLQQLILRYFPIAGNKKWPQSKKFKILIGLEQIIQLILIIE